MDYIHFSERGGGGRDYTHASYVSDILWKQIASYYNLIQVQIRYSKSH